MKKYSLYYLQHSWQLISLVVMTGLIWIPRTSNRSHWVKNIMQHSESTRRAIMPFHSDGSEVGQIKVQPPCTTV